MGGMVWGWARFGARGSVRREPGPVGRSGSAVAVDRKHVVRVEKEIVAAFIGPEDDLQAAIDDASGPVLLDFFADWCGPCRAQGKILHAVEKRAAESETLMIKINIDDYPDITRQWQVQGVPTLMMVKQGRIVNRQSGVADASRLLQWMQ